MRGDRGMKTSRGCVYKEDGKWSVAYYLNDFDRGEKIRKYKRGFRTKWEAEDFRKKAEDSKGKILQGKITLAEFCDIWEKKIKPNEYSENTLETYQCRINKYIKPSLLGKTRISEIDEDLINQFLDNLREKHKFKEQTVRHYYALLNMLLNKALKSKIIMVNPMIYVDVPKPERMIPEIWTIGESKEVIEVIGNGDIVGLMVLFGLCTGMRRGEILGLKYSDIDMKEYMVSIKHSYGKKKDVDGNVVLGEKSTKTERSQRVVSIPLPLAEKIEKMKEQQERDKTVYGDGYKNNGGFIFVNRNGERIKPVNASKMFESFIQKYNLPKIRLHDTRHSHASQLLMANVNPKVVQERLGHTSIKTTMDLYSHVIPSMQIGIGNKVDELLFLHEIPATPLKTH